jgi:hypothetical protein
VSDAERCPAIKEGTYKTGGRYSLEGRWVVHCSLAPGHEGEHIAIPNHGQGENVDAYQWIHWTSA